MRRCFDVFASGLALVVAAPWLAAVSLVVWLDAGCPILFTQVRIGRHHRPFWIYKFRTMAALRGDNRITRSGVFLRAAKWDELPQLWNVLKGDMSIIGPRPELPEYVAQFPREYAGLLSSRPGLIDPASLMYFDEADQLARYTDPQAAYVSTVLPLKLRLSSTYLASRTWRSDVRILWQGLAACLKALR